MSYQELSQKLALPKPWKIKSVQEDNTHKRLLVEITCEVKKKSWFSSVAYVTCPVCKQSLELSTIVKTVTIRHINVADAQVFLTMPVLQIKCSDKTGCPLRLHSEDNLPYTKMLEQQIRKFAQAPNGVSAAGKTLSLSPSELEQIIGAGWLPRANFLPPASNPIWYDLITHKIAFKTQNLGLQCLLTWVNGQMQRGTLSESELLSKIGMVRAYFEKYRHTLQNELNQMIQAADI